MSRTQWVGVGLLIISASMSSGCISPWAYQELENKYVHQTSVLSSADRQIAMDQEEIARLKAQVDTEQKTNAQYRKELSQVKAEVLAVSHNLAERFKAATEEFRSLEEFRNIPDVVVSDSGSLILEDGIFFASGQQKLSDKGQRALASIAEQLRSEKYGEQVVMIAGHTDSDPIKHSAKRYEDNWDLGAQRAREVLVFLEGKGIAPERMYISSFADTRPREGGQQKADQRRVEIILAEPRF